MLISESSQHLGTSDPLQIVTYYSTYEMKSAARCWCKKCRGQVTQRSVYCATALCRDLATKPPEKLFQVLNARTCGVWGSQGLACPKPLHRDLWTRLPE